MRVGEREELKIRERKVKERERVCVRVGEREELKIKEKTNV
jgi:hypothetical protein